LIVTVPGHDNYAEERKRQATVRVLIVEDEKEMAELLKKGLEEENHSVTLAHDGRTALEFAEAYEFDAIVLDIMLPEVDGFEVATRLRRNRNATPVLMVTARDAVPDVVRGLDVGADDYLTKPFAFEELLARLRSVTRRGSAPRPTCLRIADLVLDPATRQVARGRRRIHLSPTEYRLLEFLMRRPGQVASRNAIIEAVWGFDREVEENTLDAFIRLLRSKVDRNFTKKLLHTVRGVGYSLSEDPKT
jgi:DNA-binding response OmpR family regulator